MDFKSRTATLLLPVALILLGVASGCKTVKYSQAEVKGIGGNADGNTAGETYLYTVSDSTIIQWKCPNTKPILRSRCQIQLRRDYVSFENELRHMVQKDASETKQFVTDYQQRLNSITDAIDRGGPDTEALKDQRKHINSEIAALQIKIASIEAEQGSLDDTLEKLKSESIDYEINADSLFYKNNRASFQRFQDVLATASTGWDCDFLGSFTCQHLNDVKTSLTKGCSGDCIAKMLEEILILDRVRLFVPREIQKYVVGPVLGQLAKETAILLRKRSWESNNSTLLVDWNRAANLACSSIVKLQKASPSLNGEFVTCAKVIQ